MGFECVMSRIRSAMEGDVYNARIAVRGVSNLATTSAHPDWAVSSVVEHCLHTAGVTSSKLVPPTKITRIQKYRLERQVIQHRTKCHFENMIL